MRLPQVWTSCHIFAFLDDPARDYLISKVRPETFPPGFDLAQQGDDADCLWFLQEGGCACRQN
jgi:hypothetical protein